MTYAKTCDVPPLASLVLAQSSIRELRQIRVDESDHAVELSGSVRSFYHKQLAQETVRNVVKGRQLINRVKVAH